MFSFTTNYTDLIFKIIIVNQKWIAKNGMERRDAEAQSLFFERAKHTESSTYLRALCLLSKLFLCVFASLRSIFSQTNFVLL